MECKDVGEVDDNGNDEDIDERLILDVTDEVHEVEVDVIVEVVANVNVEIDVDVVDVVQVCRPHSPE